MIRYLLPLLLLTACEAPHLIPVGEVAEMQKQHITIPLAGGLATGQDGKTLPIGKSEELQNVRPGRLGEVIQRNGTRALGTTMIGSGAALPPAWALGTLRGDLVSFSGVGDHPANLYSPTLDAWATNNSTGTAPIKTNRRGPIAATLQQISGNGQQPDMVYASGFYWTIFKTTRNGVATIVQTVTDAATGLPVNEQAYAGAYISWGVRVVNGSAVFVYATAALINIDTWTVTNPAIGATNRVSVAKTVVNGARQFDMLVKDATTISVAYSDGTNVQCFDYVPTGAAATFWTPKDSAAANIPTDKTIAWMQDTGFGGAGKIALIVLHGASFTLKAHWDISTAGATRQAVSSYLLDAAAVGGDAVGFTMTSAATGQFTVLYGGAPTDATTAILRAATREAGVIGTAIYYRSLILGSKPFVGPDGKYYVATEYASTTQPTGFIVRVPETRTGFAALTGVVAKTQVNNGALGLVNVAGPFSPVSNPATNEYVYANTVQLRLPGNPTAYIPQGIGVDLVHVKFKAAGDTTLGPPKEAIDSLFTPGGAVGQFDGRSYVDAGFPYYPEQPNITSAGGGAKTAGATYSYVLVYGWYDFNGRFWPSAPSRVTSVAMGANTKNTLDCPTQRIDGRDDISIQVYAGAANDNVTFALVGAVPNDPTVDTVPFVDGFADTAYASGTALYTNGAVGNRPLAADGIPGSSALLTAGGREWFVSNDNPTDVWVSNKFIAGQGWRFSEQNKLMLADNLGPVIGLGVLPNGVVVVVKANAYYFVSGDGPNQAGNGGSFTVSTPAVGVGTTNPRSIVGTPSGVEFRSDGTTRAWYRVNTALQAEYIGSPIERYTTIGGVPSPIIGAVLVTATGETRYYTSDNDGGEVKALVHDAISDTWMVDTSADDFGNNQAVCAYGIGAAVAGDGQVVVDDPGTGKDRGVGYFVSTTIPWIKGADLDGYAMFILARGVGELPGGSPVLTIVLQADFDTSTNVTSQTVTPGVLWDWEIKYPAKLSSFRLELSYQATAVPVKMSAIVVEYGVKTGLAPLPYTKRSQ